jgi:hypothetical protein
MADVGRVNCCRRGLAGLEGRIVGNGMLLTQRYLKKHNGLSCQQPALLHHCLRCEQAYILLDLP